MGFPAQAQETSRTAKSEWLSNQRHGTIKLASAWGVGGSQVLHAHVRGTAWWSLQPFPEVVCKCMP